MIATLGFAAQSRESHVKLAPEQPGVRGSEQLVIMPVPASWAEIVQFDESNLRGLPEALAPMEVLPVPETIDVDFPEHAIRVRQQPQQDDGVEALGACASVGAEPALGPNFEAQPDVPDSGSFVYIPPFTTGGVGPAHLMTMMANQVRISTRLGALISAVDLLAFWSPLGATATTWPRLTYDNASSRWIATCRYGANPAMQIGLAVSDTSDPTGTWDFYSIPANDAGARFPDWIPHGVNGTWITITANMFNVVGGALAGIEMWVVDKSTALSGGPITVTNFPVGFAAGVHANAPSNSYYPSTSLDSSTPDMWLVNNNFSSTQLGIRQRLLQFARISGTGAAPVVTALAGSPFGGTNAFSLVANNFHGTVRNMAQVGDARFITALGLRVQAVVLRNGKIWVSHSGGLPQDPNPGPIAPDRTAAFWYQFDPTQPMPGTIPETQGPGNFINQSNLIDGGVLACVAFPTISVNCGDDALIGFSYGDPTINPEAGYVYRVGSDPLNAQSPRRTLRVGDSSYWKNFGVGTTAQWGFTSSTCVDPADDTTLWTVQEYAALRVGPADNDSRWGTWWGQLGDCETPLITTQPIPHTGCIGDLVAFNVVASAANPITYQWRKNGVDISGETTDTLDLGATVASDEATYDVVVTVCGSEISIPVALEFNEPTVTTHPAHAQASVGDSASFFVAASGTGTLSYQWQHDEVDIPLANSDTYNIASVVPQDYGQYRCVVTDDCGPVTSNSARLFADFRGNNGKLAEFDLHIVGQPQDTLGCVDGVATFEVEALPANATYEWRKNGVAIVPPETNSVLTISPVSVGDVGAYDVVVSLGSKSVVSSAGSLTVNDVPTITSHPSNQTVPQGAPASFSVTATGDGQLDYQWQRQNTPNGPWTNVAGGTSPTLEIASAGFGTAGRYRCRVTNHCGPTFSNPANLSIIF